MGNGMIEDRELRDLFKAESAEHLQKLDEGLLRLEKEPGNTALLAEVMREAHSLKGAARMLGLIDIETLSHRLEDMLNAAKKGETTLTPEAIDSMYKTLDAVKKLVHEAITEESQELGVGSSELKKVEDEVEKIRSYEVKEDRFSSSQLPTFSTSQAETPKSKIEGEAFKIETVRVDTNKLDALMTQIGELSVTKLRIALRPAEIEEIIGLWEEVNKSWELGVRSSEFKSKAGKLGNILNKLMASAYEDGSKLEFVSDELEDGIRAIRLMPLSTIFSLFPRMVRDMAKAQSKEAELVIEGGETSADKRIIEEMKDPLMHMMRNAIDHGIEKPEERERTGKPRSGTINLKAYQTATNIVIEVKDDGKGLDLDAIRRAAVKKKVCREEELAVMTPSQVQSLIFVSGFSTSSFVTDVSGRGVGLDVVRNNVEQLKGTIQIESTPGSGCTLRVQLPITLATTRVLIAAVNGRSYAIPVEHVLTTIRVRKEDVFTIEGRETVVFEGQPVSVARLSELLEIRQHSAVSYQMSAQSKIQNPKSEIEAIPCILISIGDDKLGLLVDELLDEQEIVLKPHSVILKRVRNVSGTTILGTGEVCMVLNPQDLIKSVRKREAPISEVKPSEEEAGKKVILFAEDSLTTRTQVKRILEGAGYEVEAAADGMEAFSKLGTRSFDALVTDILMPNMDGLTLTEKVRQDKKYKELPIVLVTSLASDEDRKKGMEAGANAYITKPAFDQKILLETLKRLI